LTVQAESLRLAGELGDLQARIAELEQGRPQRELPAASSELGQRLSELSERVDDLTKREIWLPPQAAGRLPAHAAQPKRGPDPDVAVLAQRIRQLEEGRARRGLASRRGARLLVETLFIVAVAVGTWQADLPVPVIVAVMAAAWVLVAAIEWATWRRGQ
jgi:hypothetical protein